MLKEIISGLTGPVAGYFQKRTELKYQLKLTKLESKIKLEEARANRKAQELQADTNWELKQLEKQGWKDDWILILLSIPLVMSFIPPLTVYVWAGFQVLAATPEWYRWLIMLIFTAIYGIRIWRRKQ